jgi:hypothetical protein
MSGDSVLPRRYQFILEAITLASVIVVADLLIGFLILIAAAGASYFLMVSNTLMIEFGAMLILGGCLMARQPLVDEKRYDTLGKPTRAWRFALLGRQVLLISVFVLLFALLFALVDMGFGL